jgi:hypothetical protein
MLDLFNFQSINTKINAPSIEFSTQHIVFVFKIINDLSFKDLIGFFIFNLKIELMSKISRFIISNLFIEILDLNDAAIVEFFINLVSILLVLFFNAFYYIFKLFVLVFHLLYHNIFGFDM